MFNMPIPDNCMPESAAGSNFIEEPLIDIDAYFNGRIFIEPIYYNKGIPGALPECYARKSLIIGLEKAMTLLPDEVTFKVFDAWRPISVQKKLYDDRYELNKKAYPEWSGEQLERETTKFVSKPTLDEENVAVHNTGGAIDLTLCYKNSGENLLMGTEFDEFSKKAYTNAFEEDKNEQIRNNRRLLYNVMINSGFTNLPSEWWHYDFGDRFWSYYTKEPAIYCGIKK